MLDKQRKIEHLTDKTRDILKGEVEVEEKVDGSQITFGMRDGALFVNSRKGPINALIPDKMFTKAVAVITGLKDKMRDGFTYHGEYLSRPHHNVLNYERVPTNHIMLFDVKNADGVYLDRDSKAYWAETLGLELVPLLFRGTVDNPNQLREFLSTKSVLGGHNIEGIVVKRHDCVDSWGHHYSVKFVSEDFKEIHNAGAKKEAKTFLDFKDSVGVVAMRFTTEARWAKARIHLKEEGKLAGEPADIGLLVREIQADVLKECEVEIKAELFAMAWPVIAKAVIQGAPQWYKEQLMQESFNTPEGATQILSQIPEVRELEPAND